jgi:peptidoglycan lytic transglycosylase
MGTAIGVGVFVISSCVEQRSMQPVGRPPGAPIPLETTGTPAPFAQAGFATFYAERFAGRRTASGERYDPSLLTAAHRTLPFGTLVEVRRADGRRVVVRVNDRGPYGSSRIIDLSRRAAEELGILQDGKSWVELRLVRKPPLSDGGDDQG